MLDLFLSGMVDGLVVVGVGGLIIMACVSITVVILFVISQCIVINNRIDSPEGYHADKVKKVQELEVIKELTSKTEAREAELALLKLEIAALTE